MLTKSDGAVFASSRITYLDTYTPCTDNRICVGVKFDNLPKTLAIVDTGAPWCVLNQEQAQVLDPGYKSRALQPKSLTIRGSKLDGVLIRIPITLCAEIGQDVTIEGTVFVPDEELDIPNFIGLDGLLCRINFAIDPQNNDFYFGPIL
jgi:hypothetical protein